MPVIKDIKKNKKDIIRVNVGEYKGEERIDIRVWFGTLNEPSGEMVYQATQKGVTLKLSQFDELKDAVERLGNYIADKK